MIKEVRQTVIRPEFNLPKEVSEIMGRDGNKYLQFNTSMLTLYKQTYGELSKFFMAIREGRLIGSHCSKCDQVMVPAATWHCPNCNFAEMKEIELPHEGILAATAPITIFPSASFIGEAPFCRGYVDVARDHKIASFLPSRLRTTTGLPRPGIFVKGIELKLVFKDRREGTILDIFWVPMSEVPAKLRDKKTLLESELNFEMPKTPEVKYSEDLKPVFNETIFSLQQMSENIKKSPRAQENLAGRKYAIGVRTGGGDFNIYISESQMEVRPGVVEDVDFTLVCEDPRIFTKWVNDGSLTDAAVEGSLWLPNREAFMVLPILDRLPRSIRRDLKK